jgi:hypothetical protein
VATSFALFTFLYSLFSEILNSHPAAAAWYATTATKMTPNAVSLVVWLQADRYFSEGGLARLIRSGLKKGPVLLYSSIQTFPSGSFLFSGELLAGGNSI